MRLEADAEKVDEVIEGAVWIGWSGMAIAELKRHKAMKRAAQGSGTVNQLIIGKIECSETHGEDGNDPVDRSFEFCVSGHREPFG